MAFALPAENLHRPDGEAVETLALLRLPVGWNEPRRASSPVVQSGILMVTASDGEKRLTGPGDVWRMEDTHGKGHHTRVLSGTTCDAGVVELTVRHRAIARRAYAR